MLLLFKQYKLSLLALIVLLVQLPMYSQEQTFEGVVVSTSRNTITVKRDDGRHQLFTFERDYTKPANIVVGSRVRVMSVETDDTNVRRASEITLVSGGRTGTSNSADSSNSQVVPPEVRRIERDIERQAKRYHVGVRAGLALDPELILLGVHAEVGPFFRSDVYFRPNVEFAFGEVTALFALSPEVIFRLPITSRQGRWSTYVGAGPGFNFIHQNFERMDGSGSRIDFGEFKSDVGLNILGGLRYRSGTFVELKTSVYSDSSPTLRLILGYNF